MKLDDPTTGFVDVVGRRRRQRAAVDAERFRLGVHGLDCLPRSNGPERSAVIGASAWALKPDQVERNLAHIGTIGGLLADLGYRICPIGSVTDTDNAPSLVAWVCGDETEADEYQQLAAIDAPGLSIGSCVDGLDTWSWIAPEDHLDDLDFACAVIAEIHWLVADQT